MLQVINYPLFILKAIFEKINSPLGTRKDILRDLFEEKYADLIDFLKSGFKQPIGPLKVSKTKRSGIASYEIFLISGVRNRDFSIVSL